mmetsp:Transcript_15406/g.31712  ORF Transcript_15406/g.31712 Transcript_15406/m.31712 type:complete len:248 (-) Transcript_15406:100-843(-)
MVEGARCTNLVTALDSNNDSLRICRACSGQEKRESTDEPEGMFPPFLPDLVYRAASAELSQGSVHVLDRCLLLWRQGRLEGWEFLEFVSSVAWQSPGLASSLHLHQPSEDGTEERDDDLELMPPELMQKIERDRRSPPTVTILPCTPRFPPPPLVAKDLNQSSKKRKLDDGDEGLLLDALCIVSCPDLDSEKTSQLARLLRQYPWLSFAFERNGWNNQTQVFDAPPSWEIAERLLRLHLPTESQEKR